MATNVAAAHNPSTGQSTAATKPSQPALNPAAGEAVSDKTLAAAAPKQVIIPKLASREYETRINPKTIPTVPVLCHASPQITRNFVVSDARYPQPVPPRNNSLRRRACSPRARINV